MSRERLGESVRAFVSALENENVQGTVHLCVDEGPFYALAEAFRVPSTTAFRVQVGAWTTLVVERRTWIPGSMLLTNGDVPTDSLEAGMLVLAKEKR